VAIENATLYRETRRIAGLLATLYEIGKETASILDLDELLQRVVEIVKRVIDYEMFAILLVDEDRQELVLRKWSTSGPPRRGSGCHQRRADRSRGSEQAADPGGGRAPGSRYVSLIPEARSELVVPLVLQDRVVGVFDVESPEVGRFTEEHVKVLTPLASQVAIAIENAGLYAALRKNDHRLQRELKIAGTSSTPSFPRNRRPAPAGKPPPTSARRGSWAATSTTSTTWGGAPGVATGDVAGRGCRPPCTRPSPRAPCARAPSSAARPPTSCSG